MNKKKIVIFSGGSGSQNLQRSIKNFCGDSVDTYVVISAYDNGKSTGEVRKVYDHEILGPSDLRKNQMLQYELYGKESPYKQLILDFMNIRFDASNVLEAKTMCDKYYWDLCNKFDEIPIEDKQAYDIDWENDFTNMIRLQLDDFFDVKLHPYVNRADFHDFSIANIIYASLAHANKNKLSTAGKIISDYLRIPNNVYLISDVNLYLNAVTESGTIISDEGQIVDWNNPNDKIKDIVLLNKNGDEVIPAVDEYSCTDCCELIRTADIIILSSGTQWSSEIPTYVHTGFNSIINESKAKKYMIMNNCEDKDMKGVNSAELIKTVSEYLDLSDFTVVYNKYAQISMRDLFDEDVKKLIKRSISGKLSDSMNDKKHNLNIFKFIMEDYYKEYLNSDLFVFDFDDTLFPRDMTDGNIQLGTENLKLLNEIDKDIFILSGNSVNRFKSIVNIVKDKKIFENVFSMLCINGGNSVYKYESDGNLIHISDINDFNIIKHNYFTLLKKLINIVRKYGGTNIAVPNFENRGNCMISIKPLPTEIRNKIADEMNVFFIQECYGEFKAYSTGNTTIDIMPTDYNKYSIFKQIIEKYYININNKNVTYVGDKFDNGGNDSSMMNPFGPKCLIVANPYDTNLFLKTLVSKR